MVSLRILAVLSVVVLLQALADDKKCEQWHWKRVGNGPIVEHVGYERKVVDCSHKTCYSVVLVPTDGSQQMSYMAGCQTDNTRDGQTVTHECLAPETKPDATALRCYCLGTNDSPCNTPKLMFDPEGDDGQMSRAKVLRVEMGIVAERKDTVGQPDVDLQYITCEKWHVEIRPAGDNVLTPKTSVPCKGTCGLNVNVKAAENGVDVGSNCWRYDIEHKCTPGQDSTGKRMICYCAGSDCNTPALLFDPEGDADQQIHVLELRKIGVITEVKKTGSQREITFKFDDGKTTTEPPTTEAATTTGGNDSSATGLSLAFAVMLTMLRLI